mmetsp:Transcript_25305/g.99944  ORF Transcript_25305/g.99944 Transcript_25305/m.99944 type:complete len:157 (-) Transcript_25305:2977-3447(-)
MLGFGFSLGARLGLPGPSRSRWNCKGDSVASFRVEVSAPGVVQRLRIIGFSSRSEGFVEYLGNELGALNGIVKNSFNELKLTTRDNGRTVQRNLVCFVRVPTEYHVTSIPGLLSRLEGSVVTQVDALGKVSGGSTLEDDDFDNVSEHDRYQYDCNM